jgi:hypothetical protein
MNSSARRTCQWGSGLLLLALPAAAAAQAYRGTSGADVYNVEISEISGQLGGRHITLKPQGALDECERDFYLEGDLMRTGPQGGTFSGTMKRCTKDPLKTQCEKLGKPLDPSYDCVATGRFSNDPQFGLRLDFNYKYEKWNQTDCKFDKKETGNETIVITRKNTDNIRNPSVPTIDEIFRGAAYGLGGPGHPANR